MYHFLLDPQALPNLNVTYNVNNVILDDVGEAISY